MSEVWKLFRFRTINRFLWRELEFSELYCARLDQLNDPLDCKVNWKSAIDVALEQPLNSRRRNTVLEIRDAFSDRSPQIEAGICCFTVNLDNPLMWSHYANSHSGVCLYYEIPSQYVLDRYPESSPFFFVGVSQVYYGDSSFSDWLINGDLEMPRKAEPIENAVSRLFCSKSSHWAHEEEARLVFNSPGQLQLKPDFLKEITFGVMTPEIDKKLVAKTVLRNNDKVVFQARTSQTNEIGLEYLPWPKADFELNG